MSLLGALFTPNTLTPNPNYRNDPENELPYNQPGFWDKVFNQAEAERAQRANQKAMQMAPIARLQHKLTNEFGGQDATIARDGMLKPVVERTGDQIYQQSRFPVEQMDKDFTTNRAEIEANIPTIAAQTKAARLIEEGRNAAKSNAIGAPEATAEATKATADRTIAISPVQTAADLATIPDDARTRQVVNNSIRQITPARAKNELVTLNADTENVPLRSLAEQRNLRSGLATLPYREANTIANAKADAAQANRLNLHSGDLDSIYEDKIASEGNASKIDRALSDDKVTLIAPLRSTQRNNIFNEAWRAANPAPDANPLVRHGTKIELNPGYATPADAAAAMTAKKSGFIPMNRGLNLATKPIITKPIGRSVTPAGTSSAEPVADHKQQFIEKVLSNPKMMESRKNQFFQSIADKLGIRTLEGLRIGGSNSFHDAGPVIREILEKGSSDLLPGITADKLEAYIDSLPIEDQKAIYSVN